VEESGPFEDSWDLAEGQQSVDIGVLADAVTAVDTGNGFTLSARSTTSSDSIVGATFTADDLEQLDDRSVLIEDPMGEYPVVFVSEEEFEDLSGVC